MRKKQKIIFKFHFLGSLDTIKYFSTISFKKKSNIILFDKHVEKPFNDSNTSKNSFSCEKDGSVDFIHLSLSFTNTIKNFDRISNIDLLYKYLFIHSKQWFIIYEKSLVYFSIPMNFLPFWNHVINFKYLHLHWNVAWRKQVIFDFHWLKRKTWKSCYLIFPWLRGIVQLSIACQNYLLENCKLLGNSFFWLSFQLRKNLCYPLCISIYYVINSDWFILNLYNIYIENFNPSDINLSVNTLKTLNYHIVLKVLAIKPNSSNPFDPTYLLSQRLYV